MKTLSTLGLFFCGFTAVAAPDLATRDQVFDFMTKNMAERTVHLKETTKNVKKTSETTFERNWTFGKPVKTQHGLKLQYSVTIKQTIWDLADGKAVAGSQVIKDRELSGRFELRAMESTKDQLTGSIVPEASSITDITGDLVSIIARIDGGTFVMNRLPSGYQDCFAEGGSYRACQGHYTDTYSVKDGKLTMSQAAEVYSVNPVTLQRIPDISEHTSVSVEN